MQKNLNQYFTPEWAAMEIVEEFFGKFNNNDRVLEPSCGKGSFLKAVP